MKYDDSEKIINVQSIIEKYDKPLFKSKRELYSDLGVKPCLSVIQTSNDPGSASYVKGIKNFCKKQKVEFEYFEAFSPEKLAATINVLNSSDTNGIMVMYPTGFENIKDTFFMNLIDPSKDVEGLHNSMLGFLVQFEKQHELSGFRKLVIPPTAKGIMYIFKQWFRYFEEYKKQNGKYPESHELNPYSLEGKKITIINDSLAVGRSLALMLLNEHASIQICHKYTPFDDIIKFVKNSDIIVSAVPSEKFIIPSDAVSESAIIIDLSFTGNFKYPQITERVFKIAPRWDLVKKGNRVNDMTLYRLLSNLFYLVDNFLPEDLVRMHTENSL